MSPEENGSQHLSEEYQDWEALPPGNQDEWIEGEGASYRVICDGARSNIEDLFCEEA